MPSQTHTQGSGPAAHVRTSVVIHSELFTSCKATPAPTLQNHDLVLKLGSGLGVSEALTLEYLALELQSWAAEEETGQQQPHPELPSQLHRQ
jgi:hypothetical protein